MNPYSAWLGGCDPIETASRTAERIEAACRLLGESGAERALAPGKWNARQILCHLADCEMVFAFRLRQALAEDHHVIQPFEQDRWAERYSVPALADALGLFAAARRWNLLLIRSLSQAELAKPVSHPERGRMTVQTIIETLAGHDLNHLAQLEALAGIRTAEPDAAGA